MTGVDEGRVIASTPGSEKYDLLSRAVGASYQAAFDVRIMKEIFDDRMDYFASWGYFSGPDVHFDGVPSHHYFSSRELAKFEGFRRAPANVSGAMPPKEELDAIAGVSPDGRTVRAVIGRFRDKLVFTNHLETTVRFRLPKDWAGKRVRASVLTLDDRNNWFPDWERDRAALGITAKDYRWSPDDFAVLAERELQGEKFRTAFSTELQPRYAKKAASVRPAETELTVSAEATLALPVSFTGNGAAFVTLFRSAGTPNYHFFIDGNGSPGDPNGAFFADGRYHLMYLYGAGSMPKDDPRIFRKVGRTFYRWGHRSSADLIHWTEHGDAIKEADDGGAFSGGAFVDDDGICYLSYWMLKGDNGAIGLVKSDGRDYTRWSRWEANPVIPATAWGLRAEKGLKEPWPVADPSNIWKKDGRYYMLGGNLELRLAFGRGTDSPEDLRGDFAGLYVSDDLKKWDYLGKFYERRRGETLATGWTDEDEDCMCPTFLELPSTPEGGKGSGKHLLSFISHNRGCQYYIGVYDRKHDRFLPERHGRMTWRDRSYFAPEAMLDGKGRQLMWTWLNDDRPDQHRRFGWCGVYALPRSLWLRPDGTLGISVPRELENLHTAEIAAPEKGFESDSCEIVLRFSCEEAKKFALNVKGAAEGRAKTVIRYDHEKGELVFDASAAGADKSLDPWNPPGARGEPHQNVECAPFRLSDGEELNLRVFIDGDIVEVFANDRQAISRRVFSPPQNLRVAFNGHPTEVKAYTCRGGR